jgi:urocanate hydratase
VDTDAVNQRITDGYIQKSLVFKDLDQITTAIRQAVADKKPVALIYHGNIVDLLEHFVHARLTPELGSDQTSLHNIDDCGYCPQGYSFDEAKQLQLADKSAFLKAVRATLRKHVAAVNTLARRGMYFWDYGNAFLKEAGEAKADVFENQAKINYKYPSYVEHIMGPMCFDYGFGPFRWVCTSGLRSDLDKTDAIATRVLEQLLMTAPVEIHSQLKDNLAWIRSAATNIPIVGSKARILYADASGRIAIAKAFNDAIRRREIAQPIVLGRDHHDVSGTDSPFRETANIQDGSRFTADMAVHNVIGDAMRGATWVSLHNGGGVGWGEVVNGGFGLVLDGTQLAERRLNQMLFWDVNNGIARRAWARNEGAISAIQRAMSSNPTLKVTLPNLVTDDLLDKLV